MTHIKIVTRKPAKAQTEHPNAGDSIKGFISDPEGTVGQHLNKDT